MNSAAGSVSRRRIKDLRESRDWSQSELGEKLNRLLGYGDVGEKALDLSGDNGKAVVSQLERGKRGLTVTIAKAYSRIFNVTLDYLFGCDTLQRPEYTDVITQTGLSDSAVRKLSILKAKGKSKLLSDVIESHNFFHVISAIEEYQYMRNSEMERQKQNREWHLYLEKFASDRENILVHANEPDSRDRLGNESVAFARYSALLLFGDLVDDISGEALNNGKKTY